MKSETNKEFKDCNFFVLLVDCLRADHLHCYGYGRQTSPEIDSIAKQGFLFEDCIAQALNTKPSVTSLLTSLYPSVHKARHPIDVLDPENYSDYQYKKKLKNLPQWLRENQFETMAFETNPHIKKKFGYEYGFDKFEFVGHWANAEEVNKKILKNVKQAKKPVFSFVHYMDVHAPYQVPKKVVEYKPTEGKNVWRTGVIDEEINLHDLEYTIARYDEQINYVDQHIGDLIKKIDEMNSGRNVFVLTADHGDSFMDHGAMDHWQNLYEELVHIPLILRLPGVEGKRVRETVRSIDIAPSILELAGLKPERMQGESLVEFFKGNGKSRIAFSENQSDQRIGSFTVKQKSVRTDKWKYIISEKRFEPKLNSRLLKDLAKWAFKGILKRERFEVFFSNSTIEELFNLETDPDETKNLSDKEKQVLEEMKNKLKSFEEECANCEIEVTEKQTKLDSETEKQLRGLGYL